MQTNNTFLNFVYIQMNAFFFFMCTGNRRCGNNEEEDKFANLATFQLFEYITRRMLEFGWWGKGVGWCCGQSIEGISNNENKFFFYLGW